MIRASGKRSRTNRKKGREQGKFIPPKAVLTSIRIPESITVKELAEGFEKDFLRGHQEADGLWHHGDP